MKKILALLLIVLTETACGQDLLVYKDEYVIEVKESYCPWGYPCSNPLSPGFYIYTGEFLSNQKIRELENYDEEKENKECARFKDDSRVRCFANFRITAFETSDPLFREQWHHKSLKTEKAWKKYGYGSPKTVAVLDTGVDCDGHIDLVCLTGYNSLTNTLGNTEDKTGHGTHVAGIIGARIDNKIGVSGISNPAILPVKVLGDDGGGSMFSVMTGFKWAVDNGANIINMSLGGGSAVDSFQELINEAHAKGIYIVAAAGNANTNNDSRPTYPANYKHVISVGSLNERGNKSHFSNYGDSVDVWAPGSNILSTHLNGGYAFLSGTSMATPVVSGAIALLNGLPDEKILDLIAAVPGECKEKEFNNCIKRCRKKFKCRYNKQTNCRAVCKEKFECEK